jgi:hypothetical protein
VAPTDRRSARSSPTLTHRDFGFPTGITLCAADPHLIVVAVASGGVNDRTGYEAADVVVKASIEGRG